jgi:hypothetical protein
MRKIQFIFLLSLASISSYSQTMGPIQLDRPDQTETPYLVPKGYIQAENGFTIENVNKELTNIVYPTTLWKYGVNERFELRLITELASQKFKDKTTTGLNPITVGFKASLCEQKGIVPKTSFIGHFTTANVGSDKFRTSFAAPSFRFLMQHDLSSRVSLSYNLGAEWDGESPEERYLYTLTMGLSLTERLGAYGEIYGFAPRNSAPEHAVDGGFTYLVNNNIMIDLSGSYGISENASDNYLSFGFSYRFRACRK